MKNCTPLWGSCRGSVDLNAQGREREDAGRDYATFETKECPLSPAAAKADLSPSERHCGPTTHYEQNIFSQQILRRVPGFIKL